MPLWPSEGLRQDFLADSTEYFGEAALWGPDPDEAAPGCKSVRVSMFSIIPIRTHSRKAEPVKVPAAKRSASVPKLIPGRKTQGCYQYEEPLKEVHYDVGFHCVCPVRIGKQSFRIVIDTGGGRSLIRKEFRDQLAKHSATCSAVKSRHRIIEDVQCSGICEGMTSNKMSHESLVELTFDSVSEDGRMAPGSKTIVLEMGELPGASDHLLMGFPDIVKFDTRFYEDADGNVYVEMLKLGITLLAESPPRAGS